ncbi:O-antigen translocase [Flavobacterium sp.]|uniref:O-antigen translocase n=1 Tax=Flavobacterium sp. TaxID=239 RepID=UPI00286D97BC|nr:O-antigen translocase [Flavobacterium sp.]
MSESKSSYRQILKATSLFGGVQFFTILIAVIRTKLITLFIGPMGVGVIGLLNSTIELIAGFTNFGLQTSATKAIAESDENSLKLSKTATVIDKLVWITGFFAFTFTLVFSYWLSILTFGNSDYTIYFIWISISLLLKQLTSGKLAILQGLRKLNNLARANLYGSLLGFVVTIPMYYYWKIDAIAPSIIISSLIGYLVAFYFSSKIKIPKVQLSNQEIITEAKCILHLGIMLSLSGFITLAASYILQIFINRLGGITQVGFYNAGFTILNSYVGIIFTVMTTDYFPRLTAAINDKIKVNKSVLEQATIAVLIITPIIIVFLVFASLIIEILYSKEFLVITAMISWGVLGMLFKAVSWSIGFILIAKGDSKLFTKTALGFNSISLILNCLGYYFYGLEGLGISFVLYYFIHFYGLKIIVKKHYDFYFEPTFYKIYLLCILMCFATFALRYIDNSVLKTILMFFMVVISILFSLYHLDKKMNLKEIMSSKFNTRR